MLLNSYGERHNKLSHRQMQHLKALKFLFRPYRTYYIIPVRSLTNRIKILIEQNSE